MKTLLIETRGPCTTLRLHRPEARNAFNEALIAELTEAFARLDAGTRVVVLTGEGAAFCAGADLHWMKASAKFTAEENRRDAAALDTLFEAVDRAAPLVIGRVNGVAMGGALGLLACCDVVAAVDTARFAFSEVRLGLVPAVISPYVMRKIGISQARRYFLTGEVFGAAAAQAMGLVHQVVPAGADTAALDAVVTAWEEGVLKCGPLAVAAAKVLVRDIPALPPAAAKAHAIDTIVRLRVSPEAQEGLGAFLQKRSPGWVS